MLFVLFAYATVTGFDYNVSPIGRSSVPFLTVAGHDLGGAAILAWVAGILSVLAALVHTGAMNPVGLYAECSTMGTIVILVVYLLTNLSLPGSPCTATPPPGRARPPRKWEPERTKGRTCNG